MPGAYKNTNCYKTLQYYKKQFTKPDYQAPFVFKGSRTEIDNGLLESSRSSLAVLLMAAAEGGDLQEYTGIENVSDLFSANEELLYNATGMLPTFFDDELEAIMLEIEKTYDGVKYSATNRGFDITSMVFVCSRDDFETSWKYVFATAHTTPKAVVLYEDDQVRVPNFVHEKGLGDHEKLKEAIRKVIPARTTTFDWKRLLPEHSGPTMHKEALRGIVATHLTRNAVSIQRVEQNELRTH